MAAPLLTTDGFQCGRLWVPPCRVARGECLQIIVPDYHAALTVGTALTRPAAGVRITGRGCFSHGAWDERGRLARLVRPAPTAAHWVARTAGIAVREAAAALAEVGFDLDPLTRISHLPGNYRALTGLAAARARRPDVMVFTTAGIDWTGRQWLARQLTARLAQWAVIELSCPYFSRGQYHVDPSIMPGAASVTAEARPLGMSA